MNKLFRLKRLSHTKVSVLVLYIMVAGGCGTNPISGPHYHEKTTLICDRPSKYKGKVIGDGHCVSLIKQCSGAPSTRHWRPGSQVLSLEKLAAGTVIATFKGNTYPNVSGWHAAIYISHDKDGILVWDQWKGKRVHKRLIRTRNDNASAGNTAQAYRVVRLIDSK